MDLFDDLYMASITEAENKQKHIFRLTKRPEVLEMHYFFILLEEIISQNLLTKSLMEKFVWRTK
ncbi:hypothetical protein [Butyrivibrio sp.]|uniref:hypothetical protein n=1 Tax=Butyrivibrio sp. TaxID=28121 RepID=UPI0025C689A2|nr:hypothetical protein [Butyrivibrio sp.]MBQ9305825.1 hypothetical protein [Butyrivibrio sp.]